MTKSILKHKIQTLTGRSVKVYGRRHIIEQSLQGISKKIILYNTAGTIVLLTVRAD